jgi:hypothetical protein
LESKHETDVEMYLKMLADTRRIFSQGLKQNFESGNEPWANSLKPQS